MNMCGNFHQIILKYGLNFANFHQIRIIEFTEIRDYIQQKRET